MSNSKLTPEQKIERKELMQIMRVSGGEIMQDSENGATAVILSEFAGSRMVRVSFSFMSPNETKFRRKVGEYWHCVACILMVNRWQFPELLFLSF